LVVARRVRHRKPLAARTRPPDDGSARMPSGRRSPAADSVVRYYRSCRGTRGGRRAWKC
jgi:hypothetical protein